MRYLLVMDNSSPFKVTIYCIPAVESNCKYFLQLFSLTFKVKHLGTLIALIFRLLKG